MRFMKLPENCDLFLIFGHILLHHLTHLVSTIFPFGIPARVAKMKKNGEEVLFTKPSKLLQE